MPLPPLPSQVLLPSRVSLRSCSWATLSTIVSRSHSTIARSSHPHRTFARSTHTLSALEASVLQWGPGLDWRLGWHSSALLREPSRDPGRMPLSPCSRAGPFLISTTMLPACSTRALTTDFPTKVALKKVKMVIPRCPQVRPARSNRGLGIEAARRIAQNPYLSTPRNMPTFARSKIPLLLVPPVPLLLPLLLLRLLALDCCARAPPAPGAARDATRALASSSSRRSLPARVAALAIK